MSKLFFYCKLKPKCKTSLTFYATIVYNTDVKQTIHFGDDNLRTHIRELRKERNITQDDLASAVGVTRQTIISLENGKYNASLQLAYKIAKYFEMNIENVFIFEED